MVPWCVCGCSTPWCRGVCAAVVLCALMAGNLSALLHACISAACLHICCMPAYLLHACISAACLHSCKPAACLSPPPTHLTTTTHPPACLPARPAQELSCLAATCHHCRQQHVAAHCLGGQRCGRAGNPASFCNRWGGPGQLGPWGWCWLCSTCACEGHVQPLCLALLGRPCDGQVHVPPHVCAFRADA